MTLEPQRRRDSRYPSHIALRVPTLSDQLLWTHDVSRRGLFIRSDAAPPMRELLRIEATLPPDDTPFAAWGVPVHAIHKGDRTGRTPGFGVQFYAFEDARCRWEQFLSHIQESNARKKTLPATEPVRRRYRRHALRLEVQMAGQTTRRLYTCDISTGGMSVVTREPIPVGATRAFALIHPRTGEPFPVFGVVRRSDSRPNVVAVEFTEIPEKRRQQLRAFLKSTLKPRKPEIVDEFDPNLE